MAGNPFYQNLDPMAAPDPVTPQAAPGDPAGFAMVTPGGRGTAPYDIQQDLGAIEADITARADAATAVSGAGVLYPVSPRQRETQVMLDSPQGFNSGGGLTGYDITQGWSGEPDESWDNLPQPAALLDTPIQGQMGTYPSATSTVQEGLQKYGTS
jgi:hypothetical protein